jgi:hypothetical protein
MRNFFEQKKQGEVIIENISQEKEGEIESLISNFEETIFEEHQKQTIISIETIAKGMLRVLTNSSEAAKDLAEKIEKVFNGKILFIHPKKESSIRVRVVLG